MKLHQLLADIDIKTPMQSDIGDIPVHEVTDNSADVKEGYVFVAIGGYSSDGHDFIEASIQQGASLIIGEKDIDNLPVPYIQVPNSRKVLGMLARKLYSEPAKEKLIIGITGTNGKTTTSYMLKHLLESSGKSCSVIGTIENIINGEKIPSRNTTPSSLILHKLLAMSTDEVVIMEVSSHGLSQCRIEGVTFDYCLFTNLHQEHLDYHGSMENYFQAKKLLFEKLAPGGTAVVNTDNPWGEKLADHLQHEEKNVYRIGASVSSNLRIADINLQNSTATVEERGESSAVFTPMNGIHNMYNMIMAFGTAALIGVSKENLLPALFQFKGVEGRFEIYKLANGAAVIVDYAHTPDAVAHCLATAKQQGAGRIVHVFGFRGDRDPGKRQEIMSVTASMSNQYILTLDDLNSVSFSEMETTLTWLNNTYGNEKGRIIPDRTKAIQTAIEESQPEDWIIITGKGHEQYQQSYKLPARSDKEIVQYLSSPENV
ncbi:UDP-N-acetylmuramoyl-L-alanyl-D-glutamate--2,6-diaminopimelate ligase [Alkalicoccus daliensis]|uniref:UDP-N-acetylmuramyl-tripeptide synthetase n=1 Tax=Alkalicoccus daliensis TaxID=745820 RepID=A0A1H0JWH9_9BACI|nr:UDP-N-acetylmuramoyl-L-alanyl-D-glutamate--2,6-diaminopimelate ligase [Alkalicoccus daliensis]SDO47853.1 UDP-N-acetylmuramoylalanyl-D-glutamate--2,6-diaminopimelate ligase [Alkalicoccus daliensis]